MFLYSFLKKFLFDIYGNIVVNFFFSFFIKDLMTHSRIYFPFYIQIPGVEILAFIAADDTHAANDIQGKSVFELPQDSQVLYGVREALRKIEIL